MDFPTTRWTLVASARGSGDDRQKALAELLSAYWPPLYVYARCKRLSQAEAQDAVQGFALHILEHEVFAKATPERGRLRHFLKVAFRHYLADTRARANAQKRGGGTFAIDFSSAESWLPAQDLDPEQAFEARWARTVMQRALTALEGEFQRGKFSGDFAVVRRYFDGDLAQGLKAVAAETGVSEAQLKSLLHRARTRYRELLLLETRDTTLAAASADEVSGPGAAPDQRSGEQAASEELKELLTLLSPTRAAL